MLHEDPEELKTYLEGLNIFYKLKADYEDKIMAEKKEIIGLPNLSWREKRVKYKTLKPKCIHCGKVGGTLFFAGYDAKDEDRKLIARCGNKERPCPLNILIYLGNIYRVDENLLDDEQEIENLKKKVIRDKNDLLFGYINTNEALERFDELKTSIKDIMEVYEYTMQHYYLAKIDNPEKKKRIQELNVEIPENIKDLKKLIEDYESKPHENAQNILDAVKVVYLESLIEKTKELRTLMYPVEYMDYNPHDNTYHLIQRFVKTSDLEQNLGGKWGVEKMVLTVEPGSTKRNTILTKTNKAPREKKPRTKTLKRRANTSLPASVAAAAAVSPVLEEKTSENEETEDTEEED